ncbi:MAG: sulfite exporter TauE/SafE family protein [Chloroflexota bacterium]
MLEWYQYILVALAAVGAGLVNALAGGGTLITFPTLIAMGLPSIHSNMTNTVALLPGYLGGIIGQKKDLQGQRKRLLRFIPAGAIGGLLGALLLKVTTEKLFSDLVPYLILIASLLLAIQGPVKAWLAKRAAVAGRKNTSEGWAILPVTAAAVYGGYFGAGLSVIILAVLGLVVDDNLTRLNAVKQAISFSANCTAAAFFAFSGLVDWPVALVMMVGALAGGMLGGKLAGKIKASTLRWLVVTLGVAIGVAYLLR